MTTTATKPNKFAPYAPPTPLQEKLDKARDDANYARALLKDVEREVIRHKYTAFFDQCGRISKHLTDVERSEIPVILRILRMEIATNFIEIVRTRPRIAELKKVDRMSTKPSQTTTRSDY